VSGLTDNEEPSVVSVAFPGPITPRGDALSAPTIWGEGDGRVFPVRRELEGLWPSARVFVLNDVTAAGYHYRRDPAEDFCIVTVSSGIGVKVFVAGRPIVGPDGRGGEIGHVRVAFAPDSPVCDCGGRGHLGAVSSGRGVLLAARRLAREDADGFARSVLAGSGRPIENSDIVGAFRRGDAWATQLVRETARPLGQMLAAIHSALGIERFVIIGGFALALGEAYRKELADVASGCCWHLGEDWDAMLTLGEPNDLMGLLGAGCYAAERLQGEQ
jgi:glucokinase